MFDLGHPHCELQGFRFPPSPYLTNHYFNTLLGISSVWLPFLHPEVSWVGFLCGFVTKSALQTCFLGQWSLQTLFFCNYTHTYLAVPWNPFLSLWQPWGTPLALSVPQKTHGISSTWIKSCSANETLQYQMPFATWKHEKHPCFEMWSCP